MKAGGKMVSCGRSFPKVKISWIIDSYISWLVPFFALAQNSDSASFSPRVSFDLFFFAEKIKPHTYLHLFVING